MQVRTETTVGFFILTALCIFFYMTFQIGVFRLDRAQYALYTAHFDDISGVQKKADVKIAGVKVGWVEQITLLQNGTMQAQALLMVHKDHKIYADGYALVRQEGMLGNKYIEIIPGSTTLPLLVAGQQLAQGQAPASVDELLRKFKTIAQNVEEITGSIKTAIGNSGSDHLRSIVSNFSETAARFAAFSQTLERTMAANEGNINDIVENTRDFTGSLKDDWPVVRQSIEQMSGAVDRDASRLADSFESTAVTVQDTVLQAKDGLQNFGEITHKINTGQGLLGKLITEDHVYRDIKAAASGLKNYFAQINRIGIIFDAHSESMWGIGENFVDHVSDDIFKKDAKGYFGFRVFPSEDRFYLIQFVAGRKGYVERYVTQERFSGASGQIADSCSTGPIADLTPTPTPILLQWPQCKETTIQHRAGVKFNIQFAKIFTDIAFRFGFFENTAGIAIDYDMPFKNDYMRWITTIEAFDFYGDDRLNDQSPHLKWLNRVFFFDNFYMTFGADDFVSKHNANAFFGIGMRFADDEIKYLISKVGTSSFG